MRRLFTSDEATEAALRWGQRKGRWRRADRRVWAEGPEDLSELDRACAAVLATGGVASHHLAGVLHGLDSVGLDGPWVTLSPGSNGRRPHVVRRGVPHERVVRVAGMACTDGLQTLFDLATRLSDPVWEQALESALRRRLVSVTELEEVATGRGAGAARIRRCRTCGLRVPRRRRACSRR